MMDWFQLTADTNSTLTAPLKRAVQKNAAFKNAAFKNHAFKHDNIKNTANSTCLNNEARVAEPIHSAQSILSPIITDPPPSLRGLAYGDGFFTTMAVYDGQIQWLAQHQNRVKCHLQKLYLYLEKSRCQYLWQQVNALAQQAEHGVIKLIFSRQSQALRGYAYSTNATDNGCLIWIGISATDPIAKRYTPIIRTNTAFHRANSFAPILQQAPITAVCLNAQLASLPSTLAGLKSLNRLDSVLAAGELERYKAQYQAYVQVIPQADVRHNSVPLEGLVRDLSGHWVEGVMSNVFYQLTNPNTQPVDQWFTPPLNATGVHGVMRQVIIDQLESAGTPVIYRNLQDGDLQGCELQDRDSKNSKLPHLHALFFCNAVRGVIPVRELIMLDGQSIGLSLDSFL